MGGVCVMVVLVVGSGHGRFLGSVSGRSVVLAVSRTQKVAGPDLAIALAPTQNKADVGRDKVRVAERAAALPVVAALGNTSAQLVLVVEGAGVAVVGGQAVRVGGVGGALVEALLAVLPGRVVDERHLAGHVVAEAAPVAEGEVVARLVVDRPTAGLGSAAQLDADTVAVGVEVPLADTIIEDDVVQDQYRTRELVQVDAVVGVLIAANATDHVTGGGALLDGHAFGVLPVIARVCVAVRVEVQDVHV